MIMSSSERAASEKPVDRTASYDNPQHIANCRQAIEQMRYQLYLLDRSQRRPSIEDYVASLLEASANELPA